MEAERVKIPCEADLPTDVIGPKSVTVIDEDELLRVHTAELLIPAGSVPRGAKVSMEASTVAISGASLLPTEEPVSAVYRIHVSSPRGGDADVRFSVPVPERAEASLVWRVHDESEEAVLDWAGMMARVDGDRAVVDFGASFDELAIVLVARDGCSASRAGEH